MVSVPAASNNGVYIVSWSAVALAMEYRLEQSTNGTAWVEIQRDGSTQRGIGGVDTGSYAYRVVACNAAGCGGYSNAASIVVTLPPATPRISYNDKSQTTTKPVRIECVVSWSSVPNATTCELLKDGTVTAYSGPLTRVSSSNQNYCATSHQVRACNAVGCSPWSTPPTTKTLTLWNPDE